MKESNQVMYVEKALSVCLLTTYIQSPWQKGRYNPRPISHGYKHSSEIPALTVQRWQHLTAHRPVSAWRTHRGTLGCFTIYLPRIPQPNTKNQTSPLPPQGEPNIHFFRIWSLISFFKLDPLMSLSVSDPSSELVFRVPAPQGQSLLLIIHCYTSTIWNSSAWCNASINKHSWMCAWVNEWMSKWLFNNFALIYACSL